MMKFEVENRFICSPQFKTIRLSYVFSKEDSFTKYLLSCSENGKKAEIYYPFIRAIVHRDDVVQGVIALVNRWYEFPQSIINFGGPQALSRIEFTQIIKKVALPLLSYKIVEPSIDFFGLPEGYFLFLFTFDFFSYIERKNPFAAIYAFKKAFPNLSDKVGLVIKVMNGDTRNPEWVRMIDLIDNDLRIFVLNQTMDRQVVLDLYAVTDCFVSLHRSEGFGRGPAEAMYLQKPVIVTNYSGNTDFTLENNSCLVDYKLIPVKKGQYVFEDGQVWADPDIDHAAWYMHKLFENNSYAREIGERGQQFIQTKFSPHSIAKYYFERLNNLELV